MRSEDWLALAAMVGLFAAMGAVVWVYGTVMDRIEASRVRRVFYGNNQEPSQ